MAGSLMAASRKAPSISSTTIIATVLLAVALVFLGCLTAYRPPKSAYHALFLSLADNATASRHLHALTRRPHVAGTPADSEAAAYVAAAFSSYSLRAHSAPYEVLLTYPVRRSLTLARSPQDPPVAFELVQEVFPEDPSSRFAGEVMPTFHGFAKSGTAAGRVVYVNYGRVEDYATLRGMGVEVRGAVVLARYGKIFRGDIVNNAKEAGAAAAVLYSDRRDFGGGPGGKAFPEGRWLPASGVQIGTVYRGVGDPTTPGWASVRTCERVSMEEVEAGGNLPGIPSLPVSGRDGEEILRSLGGQVAADDWQGVEGGLVYRVGPGPGFLNLTYEGKQTTATIRNVFGVIEGEEEPDRYVLLGNHRDAWTFGAVDPNSGTSALLEVTMDKEVYLKHSSDVVQ
uniref:Putative glutamate carboxypeptidase 2 n=1 Tax=Anthurium amnicola TaxID=1678845 RepID=A0A1D1XNF0_9ARAE